MPHYSLLKRQRNGGAGKRRRGRTTASWGRSTWKDRKSVTLCIYVFSLLLVPFTQSSSPLCAYINKYFFHLYPRARLLLLINAFSFPPLWTRKRPGIYHLHELFGPCSLWKKENVPRPIGCVHSDDECLIGRWPPEDQKPPNQGRSLQVYKHFFVI